MSNQQLGKCRMLPYEVLPNLLLQSLVRIDSVHKIPQGIVNLLCWGLVCLSEKSQAWHCQGSSNIQLVQQPMLIFSVRLLLIRVVSATDFTILFPTIKSKQHYCSFAKATSFYLPLKSDIFYVEAFILVLLL